MIYQITYEAKGQGRHKVARPVRNREQLLALRNSAQNLEHLAKTRQGDESEKAHLVQLAYNLGHADGKLAGCKSIGSFFFHDVDLYGNDASAAEEMKQLILSKKDEIGLAMLERSASGGWHLVCRRVKGTTILENQVRVACILKLEMDTNTHDLQRVSFSTSGSPDDLVYLDDALFEEPMTAEACEDEYLRLKIREKRGLEQVPPGAKKANKHYRPWEETSPSPVAAPSCNQTPPPSEGLGEVLSFKGRPYTEIIDEWWQRTGGTPQEGERNVRLYQLAVNLRAICDNNKALLLQVMPRLGLSEQELEAIVDSACKETPKGISKQLREIIGEPANTTAVETTTPPQMPEKLPKLIELLTSRTPDVYKPAVANAVFPPLATHLCGVRFTYTDNVEHEATLMNCLMAGTGAGKGCIDKPIDRIMADIRRRDKENEQREAEWKKDCQKRGANKDKMMRPEGLVIQEIDPDMTKPALVTRMDEAEGHFVYVKLNELDLFEQLKGQTGKQHFQLMCLAFDADATYGQTRVGVQSVTARPRCRFNWNACTTILKGRRFFQRVLTDGPISRINFCTIPEQEIGAEQPVYGQYDFEFDEQLRPYIEQLVSAKGLTDCPQATALATRLQHECAEFARLSQSEVYWNLSHRACVIAWLKACVLYVANGLKWEKTIDDFIRWSLQYDLWCKMQFFGEAIKQANSGEEARIGRRGPRNLLELLPDEFTIEAAQQVRRQQGLEANQNATAKMVRNWKSRGYVTQISDISFQKNHLPTE